MVVEGIMLEQAILGVKIRALAALAVLICINIKI